MKNQPSIPLTHAGYNVRVVLDRNGIAYPIWGAATHTLIASLSQFFTGQRFKNPNGKLPSARVRESFKGTLEKAARSLGAKGSVRI